MTVDLPEDVVLQLWVKFHLRRSTRGGFGYRRKVYNYKDDCRDGVSYGVLMKRLGAHVITEADGNMDEEIDPQVRIDTMMDQAGRLEPPATAFNTRGHILGNDTFLNAAFLSRLMCTHSGLKMEQAEDAPIFALKEKYEEIKARWEKARAQVSTHAHSHIKCTRTSSARAHRSAFHSIPLDRLPANTRVRSFRWRSLRTGRRGCR